MFLDYGMKNLVRATRNSSQHPAHRYLVWMLEDLEAQNSQLEELTIRNANSELPEAVIQLQRVAALVKVPAKKKKNPARLTVANDSLLSPSNEMAPASKPLRQMICSCTLKCLVKLLVVHQNKMLKS